MPRQPNKKAEWNDYCPCSRGIPFETNMKSRTLIQLFVLLSLCYFLFFFRIGAQAVIAALLIAGLITVTIAADTYAQEHFPVVLTAANCLIVSLVILGRYLLSRPPPYSLIFIGPVTTLGAVIMSGYVARIVDRYNSPCPFCNTVFSAVGPDDRLVFYRSYRPNVHFYMHRLVPRLNSPEDVDERIESVPQTFLLPEERDADKVNLGSKYQIRESAHAYTGSRDMLCAMAQLA